MAHWIIYSVIAAVFYGLSAIPLRLAVGRGIADASGIVLLASCIGSFSGAIIYFLFAGTGVINGINRNALFYGGISGLISFAGSFSVIKAIASPFSTVSNVMSLVNTSVLFTLSFSLFLLREVPEGTKLIKSIIGTSLICAGSIILCR